jgi:hypothetical protein
MPGVQQLLARGQEGSFGAERVGGLGFLFGGEPQDGGEGARTRSRKAWRDGAGHSADQQITTHGATPSAIYND